MSRQLRTFWAVVLSGTTLLTGCQPVQPFFLFEDNDLSHYVGVATEIEYPKVSECTPEGTGVSAPPITLHNAQEAEPWDLTLQEVTRITLNNSEVIRQLGGAAVGTFVGAEPESITRTIVSPVGVTTIYDPAIVESSTGTATGTQFGGTGTEAALAEFDAQVDASVFWDKTRMPQNRPDAGVGAVFSPALFAQDLGTFTAGITKFAATGTQFSVRNNTNYEGNNLPAVGDPGPNPFTRFKSSWSTNYEFSFSHPLLQGSGTEYNRIAGPMSFQQYAAGGINPIDGVLIARIRSDLTLADFEGGVRNLMCDVEDTYWDLYFRYRDLQAKMLGRDSALETWRVVHAKFLAQAEGGNAAQEAQAKSQYYLFKAQVELALTELLQTESNLRYLMGLPAADGRLIRPADEPTTAKVNFDWAEIQAEALVRRVEIRKQKWEIKRRELELIAARNHLLPRIDAVGTYRWRGLGDELIDPNGGGIDTNMNGLTHNEAGSNAFDELLSGDFPEWRLGLQASVPLGFRKEISQVRHHEWLLARDRALLQEVELDVTHQLAGDIRSLELHYANTESFFNRRVAAEREVQTVQVIYEVGQTTLDQLLDAQRRRAEAESEYFQSLVNYNKMIMRVHCDKGSALDYNGVYLAEGPWPGKAYFDALRRARQRDASMYLDYAFTAPGVISKGPYPQTSPYGHPSGTSQRPLEGETVPPGPTKAEQGTDGAGPEELVPPPGAGAIDGGLQQPTVHIPSRLPSIAEAMAGQNAVVPASFDQPLPAPGQQPWNAPAPLPPHAVTAGAPMPRPLPLPQQTESKWLPSGQVQQPQQQQTMPGQNGWQTVAPGAAPATYHQR